MPNAQASCAQSSAPFCRPGYCSGPECARESHEHNPSLGGTPHGHGTRFAGSESRRQLSITACHPEDVFTPADLTDDQKLIGQTAEEFVAKEVMPVFPSSSCTRQSDGRDLKKAGEIGLLGGAIPESYGGAGLDKVSATVLAEKVSGYASFAVSHGGHAGIGTIPIVYFGTEEQKKEISAQDRHRRTALVLLPLRAASRFGRSRRAHPRSSLARRQELHSERPEDVDHQRRLRRRLHRLRQNRRREILVLHRREGLPGLLRRRRRKKDGHQGQLDRADLFRKLPGPERKSVTRSRPRPHRRFQYAQRRPLFAWAPIASAERKKFSRPPRNIPRNAPRSASSCASSA